MFLRSPEMSGIVSQSRLRTGLAVGGRWRDPIALSLALVSAGCTVGPNFRTPAAPMSPRATIESARTTLPASGGIDAMWWQVFGDPVLDKLEECALAGNLDLAEASARIGGARARLRIAGASGLPQLDGAASYQRERASPVGILSLVDADPPAAAAAGGTAPFGAANLPGSDGSSAFDVFQAGFDANWELDLWGKARRTREASRADAQSSVLQRGAARVSLSAEVARAYMQLRGAEARLVILRDNRKTVAAGLRIADDRLSRGAATRFDSATAGTQLATIDAALPSAERAIAEARNALALLAGAEPHALDTLLADEVGMMPKADAALPSALLSDLARTRPDIMAAETALHAATARIGAAKADFYPSISLNGSFGLQSLSADNFPLWNARQYIVGPVMQLPLFEGGRLKGNLELARTDQQAAVIRYRATVLRAWHEIDDALEALRTTDAQLGAAKAGVDQARVAAHVSERRYAAGATGYLDVLVSQRARLDREAEWVGARTARAVAVVALYKALGGGWKPPLETKAAGA